LFDIVWFLCGLLKGTKNFKQLKKEVSQKEKSTLEKEKNQPKAHKILLFNTIEQTSNSSFSIN